MQNHIKGDIVINENVEKTFTHKHMAYEEI